MSNNIGINSFLIIRKTKKDMLMKKNFTRENIDNKKKKVVVPSDNTLNFLKQFARIYYYEESLPDPMNKFYMN